MIVNLFPLPIFPAKLECCVCTTRKYMVSIYFINYNSRISFCAAVWTNVSPINRKIHRVRLRIRFEAKKYRGRGGNTCSDIGRNTVWKELQVILQISREWEMAWCFSEMRLAVHLHVCLFNLLQFIGLWFFFFFLHSFNLYWIFQKGTVKSKEMFTFGLGLCQKVGQYLELRLLSPTLLMIFESPNNISIQFCAGSSSTHVILGLGASVCVFLYVA